MKPESGFTLAEVLITLGIIGVVAAMTLPAVVNKYKKIETETRLKKAYSVINQALTMAVSKYGDVDSWEWDDAEFILKKYIAPEIKNAKVYARSSSTSTSMCFEGRYSNNSYDDGWQYGWMDKIYISTPFYSGYTASIKLPDGTCIGLNPKSSGSPKHLFIDINGSEQAPNMAGYDLFFFVVVNNKVVPYGYDWQNDRLSNSSVKNSCHVKARLGGMVCAAYIMSKDWTITYW